MDLTLGLSLQSCARIRFSSKKFGLSVALCCFNIGRSFLILRQIYVPLIALRTFGGKLVAKRLRFSYKYNWLKNDLKMRVLVKVHLKMRVLLKLPAGDRQAGDGRDVELRLVPRAPARFGQSRALLLAPQRASFGGSLES